MNKAFEKIVKRLDEMIHPKQLHFCKCARGRCRLFYNNKNCMDCVVKDAKEIVQEVAEEYNNGWIPCSERLPEESGYYLVTYHYWSDGNFLPKYDDTYVRRLHYQISEHFVGWNYPKNVDDRAENDCHKEVIAWQPLPEPYQPKGE